MASSQEKRPNEIIPLSADFTAVLIDGDTLVSANTAVTVRNALTDVDTTADILVVASKTVTGNVLACHVKAGADGETHIVTFSTGATTQNKLYEATITLVITDYPSSDDVLCGRDEVKRELGLTDDSENALLDDLILSASGYIRTRTGVDFTLRKYQETILRERECDDGERLQVSHWPLRAVSEIAVNGYGQPGITFSTESHWVIERPGFIRWTWDGRVAGGWFAPYPGTNVVTYRAGFSRTPDDVRELCKRIACIFYQGIGREGLTSERIGNYSWSRRGMSGALPKSVASALENPWAEDVLGRYTQYDLDEG